MAGNPFRASQVAFVSTSSTIGLRDRVNAKNNARDVLPVGTGFFRIKKAHVGDGVLLIIGRERRLMGSQIFDFGIKRRHARNSCRSRSFDLANPSCTWAIVVPTSPGGLQDFARFRDARIVRLRFR